MKLSKKTSTALGGNPKKQRGQLLLFCEKIICDFNLLYQENRIAAISGVCGIIGLLASLLIFFYTLQISDRQNLLEREAREKETNSLIDNDLLPRILMVKEIVIYRKNQDSILIQDIIAFEESYYQLLYLRKLVRLERPASTDSSISELRVSLQRPISSFYLNSLSDLLEQYKNIIEMPRSIYADIWKSDLVQDSIFRENHVLHRFNGGVKHYRLMEKFNRVTQELKKYGKKKPFTEEDAYELYEYIEKEELIYLIINYLRFEIQYFDSILMRKVLKS